MKYLIILAVMALTAHAQHPSTSFDGCNTTTCETWGQCYTTTAYCPSQDRTKFYDSIPISGTLRWSPPPLASVPKSPSEIQYQTLGKREIGSDYLDSLRLPPCNIPGVRQSVWVQYPDTIFIGTSDTIVAKGVDVTIRVKGCRK